MLLWIAQNTTFTQVTQLLYIYTHTLSPDLSRHACAPTHQRRHGTGWASQCRCAGQQRHGYPGSWWDGAGPAGTHSTPASPPLAAVSWLPAAAPVQTHFIDQWWILSYRLRFMCQCTVHRNSMCLFRNPVFHNHSICAKQFLLLTSTKCPKIPQHGLISPSLPWTISSKDNSGKHKQDFPLLLPHFLQ